MILQNLNKPLTFHLNNLRNNNIVLKNNIIKNLLQKLREETYPIDNEYLNNIINETIDLDINNPELNKLPFCLSVNSYINPYKNSRVEKIIILGTIFQIKLFSKVSQIFIDGTFKSCPKIFIKSLK